MFVTGPQEVLFYADSLYGHVGFIDVSSSTGNRADLHLVAYSPRPVGVAYDPVFQVCLHLITALSQFIIKWQHYAVNFVCLFLYVCLFICLSVCLFRLFHS